MDRVSKSKRSAMMSRVRQKNTAPEVLVRQYLHARGYRFRLHRKDLPGNPDIVLPKYHTVIFVNGCFWHGHSCPRGKRPSTNMEFWNKKLIRNVERDRENYGVLQEMEWRVVVVWECETKNLEKLASLRDFTANN